MRTPGQIKELGTQLVNYLLANGHIGTLYIDKGFYDDYFSVKVEGSIGDVELWGGITISKDRFSRHSVNLLSNYFDMLDDVPEFEYQDLSEKSFDELVRIINELENHK